MVNNVGTVTCLQRDSAEKRYVEAIFFSQGKQLRFNKVSEPYATNHIKACGLGAVLLW